MRYANGRFAGAMMLPLFFPIAMLGGTMAREVTLTLGANGMQSFGSYHYYPESGDASTQRYEQYHVIVNGDAEESTAVHTDVWSNNLSSSITPQPPTCYNARITITVYLGALSCCTSPTSFYSEAGARCLQGPPPRPPDDGGELTDINYGSPILIDLGAQSYRLTSASDGVLFDLRNEGVKRRVAWTEAGAENAFLAMDRNANGTIDSGAELFGDSTVLRSGQVANHGFEALAELDENGDGVVNASDSSWAILLLWTDRNHDGISAGNELARLSSSQILALETDFRTIGKKDRWGNLFRYGSHARFAARGRGQRPYYDVFLTWLP